MEINPLYPALISGFIGAIIGGLITLIATLMNQRHQQKLQQQRLDHELKINKDNLKIPFLIDIYSKFLILAEQLDNSVTENYMFNQLVKSIHSDEEDATIEQINFINSKQPIHFVGTLINKMKGLISTTGDKDLISLVQELGTDYSNDENTAEMLVTLGLIQIKFGQLIAELSDSTFNIPTQEK